MKSKDITGLKFNRLTVIGLHHKTKRFNKDGSNRGYIEYWSCKCDCGNTTIVEKFRIIYGTTQSCGCLQKQRLKESLFKHGMCDTRIFKIWSDTKTRCLNPKCRPFKYYGGRGITICDEWQNDFQSFYDWSMSNGYKENLTLDRINVNGDYEPSNCRWVDMKTQSRNKRTNRNITYNGETHCLSEWAEILNIRYKTLFKRLSDGWSVERAFSTPILGKLK